MPYEIKISDRLITIRMFGLLTSEELALCSDELVKIDTGSPVSLDRVTDLTEIDALHLDFGAVDAIAARRRAAAVKNSIKSALVAPKPVQFGLSRMFQTLATNPKIQIEIFKDRPGAMKWLSKDPKADEASAQQRLSK